MSLACSVWHRLAPCAADGLHQSKIMVCPVPAILADTRSVPVFQPGTDARSAGELYTVR